MENDFSRELVKWKALDRWENEGGRPWLDRIEHVENASKDDVRTVSATRTHPKVEQQSYSDK